MYGLLYDDTDNEGDYKCHRKFMFTWPLCLTDICRALLEFVETSCFGDYEFRIKVLKSFQSEMAMLGSMMLD